MSNFKYTPKNSVKASWVKKLVTKTAWNTYYGPTGSYCSLRTEGVGKRKGVWISFIVAGKVPFNCEKLTDEELRQTDAFCRGRNIRPFPLEEVKIKKKLDSDSDFDLVPAGY